jgi:hypothetical protein
LTPKECDALWTVLSGADPQTAYRAIWKLAANAEQAIPYLQVRLTPIEPVDPNRLARLIAHLDSERYPLRQQAMQELEALGEQAEPALRQVPHGKGTLEFRRRVETLLQSVRTAPPPPEQLRQLRAIEVLEHAKTAGARHVLEALAQGAPDARLTQDAKAALNRLYQRGAQ